MTVSVQGVRDEDLAAPLAAAIEGDASAFAVLWRSLHPPVLRYLRVVCGDAAEDVASETWLQVSRDLSRFDGTATAFRVWLFRIARHRGIDENRRAWRRHEEPHEAVEQLRVAATARDVAAEVVELDETDRALRMIASLPRDQAEAVMLRVVAGLDVAGTARVLGKRSGAVRVAAMRGLRRLAEHPELRAADGVDGPGRARSGEVDPARSGEIGRAQSGEPNRTRPGDNDRTRPGDNDRVRPGDNDRAGSDELNQARSDELNRARSDDDSRARSGNEGRAR
ncbi:RNA polymerase sigma factor [Dactylosporangium sp. NPDC049140]|uniref:RNA polymerase sigma factor n=1 Tax=Dactylosporangium sp. NPDC049140 TaxID=3155647 RepID=UPI003402F60C